MTMHHVQQTYQSGVVDGHNEVKEGFETCSVPGRILLHLHNRERRLVIPLHSNKNTKYQYLLAKL